MIIVLIVMTILAFITGKEYGRAKTYKEVRYFVKSYSDQGKIYVKVWSRKRGEYITYGTPIDE